MGGCRERERDEPAVRDLGALVRGVRCERFPGEALRRGQEVGFCCAAAAFEAMPAGESSRTGLLQTTWREEIEKFRPRPRFDEPVPPWERPPG